MEKKRFIKLYPDMVAVYTIGPMGDGTDNIIEEYPDAKVIYTYDKVYITDRDSPSVGWVTEVEYPTEEIIMIVK